MKERENDDKIYQSQRRIRCFNNCRRFQRVCLQLAAKITQLISFVLLFFSLLFSLKVLLNLDLKQHFFMNFLSIICYLEFKVL